MKCDENKWSLAEFDSTTLQYKYDKVDAIVYPHGRYTMRVYDNSEIRLEKLIMITIIYEKYFSDNHFFSYIVRVITWRA